MHTCTRRELLGSSALVGLIAAAPAWAAMPATKPPVARVAPVTDDYFGTKVTDNYRWMENNKDPEWAGYLKGQSDHAHAVLESIPGRDKLLARISQLSGDAAATYAVQPAGGRLFYQQRPAGGANFMLFVREAGGAKRVLVDPTVMKQGDAHVALDWWAASPDGSHVAYGLSAAGSESSTGHVMVVATGEVLPARIPQLDYANVNWLPDGTGFFYNQLTGTKGKEDYYRDSHAKLHRVGTDPAADPVIMKRGMAANVEILPVEFPGISTAPGSGMAVLALVAGVQRDVTLYSAPLADVLAGRANWRHVCSPADKVTGATLSGNDLYLLSNRDAVRGRVLKLDARAPDLAHAAVAAPMTATVYEDLTAARDAVYLKVMDAGVQKVSRLTPDGRVTAVAMPFDGGMNGLFAAADTDGVWFDYSGEIRPVAIYRYDPGTGRIADTGINPQPPVDLSPYESFRILATARDGARVPLLVTARKGLRRDGRNPCLVEAYGSYQISQTPAYLGRMLAFLDAGGVFAVAQVRGGGEFGREWWQAGKGANKPNTWRDLIDGCQALVKAGITSPGKLAILGGSAGGITMGMALTERPDLFAVVISQVGVSNALRAELGPNGPPNVPEFGTAKDPAGAKNLIAMDALSHVRDGTRYPSVLLTTGAQDPRVDPWHAGKMAARLQAATGSANPVLLRVEYDAGHGIGSTRTQRDVETADEMAFILWRTGTPGYQPA